MSITITAKSLCCNTKNFFRNHFMIFLLIALLCAFIMMMFTYVFSPNQKQIAILNEINPPEGNIGLLELVESMTPEQQKILLCVSASSTFSGLIGNTILAGGVLSLIQLVLSGHHRVSTFLAISKSSPILPKLFILIFLVTTLVQIGMMFLIIPGLLLAIILAFSPIIIIQDKKSIFTAIGNSVKLSWGNIRLVSPAIIIWMIIKILLLLFALNFSLLTSSIGTMITNTVNNLISEILLIYLFRLYMLIH